MQHKVSVVMATYNGEKFIRKQLESIINQTVKADEIIIIDDNSSDSTVKIIDEFSKINDSIKYIKNENNIGINNNFQKAISYASGDIIGISDQDDLWLPNKIEILKQELINNPEIGLIYCDAQIIDGDDNILEKSELDFFKAKAVEGTPIIPLLYKNCISGHNIFFKKNILDSNFSFPEYPVYDQWLGLYFSCKSKIKFTPDKLTSHRIHSQNFQNGKKNKTSKKNKLFNRYKKMNKKSVQWQEAISMLMDICESDREKSHIEQLYRFYKNYKLTYSDKKYREILYRDIEHIIASKKVNLNQKNKYIERQIIRLSRGGLHDILEII